MGIGVMVGVGVIVGVAVMVGVRLGVGVGTNVSPGGRISTSKGVGVGRASGVLPPHALSSSIKVIPSNWHVFCKRQHLLSAYYRAQIIARSGG